MGLMDDMVIKAVKSLDSVEKRLDDIEEKLQNFSAQNNQLNDLHIALAEIRGELKGIRGGVELNVNQGIKAGGDMKVDKVETKINTDGEGEK